ncbi:protein tyrosine phosphatase domain-containing protein 1-like isoform X2 [Antedon mediterranea]
MSSGLTSSTGQHISSIVKPTSKYNVLSNGLRQITPGPVVCSMFCGGKGCKYDNPSKWSEDQMAVRGLYSSWVTDEILATSRPSTEAINKYDIIPQFKAAGIKSIINLQTAGEHASCGNPLEPSGFSYDPEDFMQEDIFCYNFGWDDYGVRALASILDMIKVMDFAVQQGKVAVHCHAGLGRTGVLIACYLIYSRRMDADHAIHYVREKRKGAIQTKGQMECCQQFAQFLIPLRVVFSSCDPCAFPFTLEQYLNRQRYMLHGFEERNFKHTPKIVSVVCQRLLELAASIEPETSPNQSVASLDIKQLHPKAFNETREGLIQTEENTAQTGRTQDDVDSLKMYKKLPPLKRLQSKSSSMELLERSANGGKREESDDDIKTSSYSMSPHQSIQRQKTSSPTAMSRSLAMRHIKFSRSQYILSNAHNLEDDSSVDDVFIVSKAFAFDIDVDLKDGDTDKRGVVEGLRQRVESLQMNLNAHNNTWNILVTEEDPFVLSCLMWSWLHHLKEPVISRQDVDLLCDNADEDPCQSLSTLAKGLKNTVMCIVNTMVCLRSEGNLEKQIVNRIVYGLTHVKEPTPDSQLSKFATFIINLVSVLEKRRKGDNK